MPSTPNRCLWIDGKPCCPVHYVNEAPLPLAKYPPPPYERFICVVDAQEFSAEEDARRA